MDYEILERLKREEADLQRKLTAVHAMLAAYGHAPRVVTQATTPSIPSVNDRDKKPIESFSDYGRRVIACAMSMMIGRSGPTKTRALVSGIESLGQEIRGENKINSLGALLSRSADITSHGKAGWTLANPHTAQQIVAMYGRKENEPPNVSAGGSNTVGEGEATPNPTQDQSNWGHGA